MNTRKPDWADLDKWIEGDVVRPGDPRYDGARQLANLRFDAVRPHAVVYCQIPTDVRTTLRFAHDLDLHVAVRSGGSSTAGYSTTSGLVLDVSRLATVTPGAHTVTIGPGVRAVDAATALAPYGLAVPAGFGPTVSAGGFLLGGGLGLLTRSGGVGSDRLRSALVVLADGRIVSASAESEPDLFWALRGGGGGNFGVVTAYELEPIPVSTVVNFGLGWEWDSAADVVAAWQHWAPTAPDGLTSWLGLFLDGAPGAVGRAVAFGMWQGPAAHLDPLLAQLTGAVAAAPMRRAVEELPYLAAMTRWWIPGDPAVQQCSGEAGDGGVPTGRPFQTVRGRMFDAPMPAAGIGRFLAAFAADRRAGQYRSSLSAALGGVAGRPARTDTAFVHRTARYHLDYTVKLTAPSATAADRAAADRWTTGVFDAIDPYSNGESYQNYPDPALRDWAEAYYAENHPRLREVKRRYDPDGFFRFAQAVGQRPDDRGLIAR
jgi:FAD/FMN-containing dehydrogenase